MRSMRRSRGLLSSRSRSAVKTVKLQWISNITIVPSTSNTLFNANAFTLNQAQDATTWNSLYDEFRIKKITFQHTTTSCETFFPSGGFQDNPVVSWECLFDPNDGGTPTATTFTSASPGSYKRCILWDGSRSHSHKVSFRPAADVNQGLTGFTMMKTSPWCRTADGGSIVHGYIKNAYSLNTGAPTAVWNRNCRMEYRVTYVVQYRCRV